MSFTSEVKNFVQELARAGGGNAVFIGDRAISAAELGSATGSLAAFAGTLASAIKAKNLTAGVEVSLEEGIALAAELGFGEPWTGILKVLLPMVFAEIRAGSVSENAWQAWKTNSTYASEFPITDEAREALAPKGYGR